MRDDEPAAVPRLGPRAGAARDVVGRRPPRRLAAVGPRPPRARDARPGRRPAAASRATSRCRSWRPPPSRPGTSTSSATTTAATTSCCWRSRSAGRRRRGGVCCRGRSIWRPGPTTSRPDPTARFRVIRSRADLAAYEAARRLDPRLTAGLLAIEGAHALDGDPANVEVVADAGFRMMSPSHFFDNAFGGSAHGIEKGGLTDAGREMVERMEARGMLVDVAHASAATDRRHPGDGRPAGRRLAHRVPRRRRQQPAT